MDENNENFENNSNVQNTENNGINTEELKNEVKDTFSEVKQAVKDTNLKNEANAAKNFISNFFKSPFSEMKKIVETPKSFLKIAIIVFVVWVVAKLISSIISIVGSYSYSIYSSLFLYFRNSFRDFFDIIWAILSPAVIIALLSVIIFLFMKEKKKSYLTIMISVIVAKIPVILASIVSLLSSISSELSKITSSFSSICSAFSMILVYFAIKALYESEDDDKTAKTFLITMAIYYAVLLLLKFFNLYV